MHGAKVKTVVHRFTGGPSVLWQSHPSSLKIVPHLAFWLQDKEEEMHPQAN
jgi:hypothetical protein